MGEAEASWTTTAGAVSQKDADWFGEVAMMQPPLKRISSNDGSVGRSEDGAAYVCTTPLSQVSTAPCTPALGPLLLTPAGPLGESYSISGVAWGHCPLQANRMLSKGGSTRASPTSSSEGVCESMPDTDDEFEAPIGAPIGYPPMATWATPVSFVTPFVLCDEAPVLVAHHAQQPPLGGGSGQLAGGGGGQQQQQWRPAVVGGEEQNVGGDELDSDASSWPTASPPSEQTVLPEDGIAADDEFDDEANNEFFRSISFVEFMAAYKSSDSDAPSVELSVQERLADSLASGRRTELCRLALAAWAATRSSATASGTTAGDLENEERFE